MDTSDTFEVIIIGMGPVGLSMANLLGKRGISVTLIDKEKGPLSFPRAIHGDDETLRIFDAMGLGDQIRDIISPFKEMEMVDADGHILTSIVLDQRSGSPKLPTDYWFFQPELEEVLETGLERYSDLTPYRGWEAIGCEESGNGFLIEIQEVESGRNLFLQANWLIGCDGGRSWVRSLMQVEMKSLRFDQSWIVIDTLVEEEEQKLLPQNHQQICDPNRPATYVPGVGKHRRWEFMLGPKESRLPIDELKPLSLELLSYYVDVNKVEIIRIAPYTYHALLAKKWRKSRMFIAGDAAHQMPPFLGQGMCTGIRDADNLSWKLAEVIKGNREEDILDTYQKERYHHTVQLTRGAIMLGKIIQSSNSFISGVRNWVFKNVLSNKLLLQEVQNKVSNRADYKTYYKGYIGKHKFLSGTLFPYFEMHDAFSMENSSSDNYLGESWTVLARDPLPCSNKPNDMSLLCLNPPSGLWTSFQGNSDIIEEWFDRRGVDFLIIRPDKYIYEAGKSSQWREEQISLSN
ncbi:MAG: bifunctional 3-(3-hydroxy-phenyl)propionate/3-hydroxycinnamic acid hydroxylase [Bacteroidota bacterium]